MPSTHLTRYATAYIRGGLYAIVAFLGAFIAEFEHLEPATLRALTLMGWGVCWAKVFLPTAITLRAFFDGTMERIAKTNTSAASP